MAEYPRTLWDRCGHIHEVAGKNAEVGEHFLAYCHRAAALLKGWLMGTHQGAVSHEHLDYYLDEYTFRFNRRTSRHRGMLFYRLLQHAIETDSVKYGQLIKGVRGPLETNDSICCGYAT